MSAWENGDGGSNWGAALWALGKTLEGLWVIVPTLGIPAWGFMTFGAEMRVWPIVASLIGGVAWGVFWTMFAAGRD